MNNWKDYIDKKIEGISFDEVEIITSEHGEFRSYFKEGTYLSGLLCLYQVEVVFKLL